MITDQPFPLPDPSVPDPAADLASSGGGAEREGDLREVDEISAIALALLRALRVETMDPWNSPTCLPGERVRAGDPPMAYSRLTRTVRVNLAVRARMVEGLAEGTGAAMARQDQIRMLTEASAIGMDLLRALQQEVVDPDNAPTARQGRRVGAGHPALALARISRAIRLNHAIKSRIADGSLGRRRQSRSPNPGQPDAPFQGSAAPRDPARPQAAAASARDPAGAPNAAAERFQETADPDLETDGIETETEDLFAEFDEDFEDEDEFAGLDGLSHEESMALVRRDFARCFQGKARAYGTAAPAEPPGGDDPPGRGRPRSGAETASPSSTTTENFPGGLGTWFESPAGAGVPDDSGDGAPAESPPAPPGHSRDPP